MVNHQNSLALGGSLIPSDSELERWSFCNFEDMSGEELEHILEGELSQSSSVSLSDSLDPSSQHAPPNSSSSPGETDQQFTPSSTANDQPSDENNADELPVDFGTEYTNSPNEAFDQVSPYSSRSDDYSYVSQPVPHGVNDSSSFAHRSRESTGGLVSDLMQQQWSSFDTIASDSDIQLESPQYHDFHGATVAPAGTLTGDAFVGMDLPLRTVQQSQAWVSTGIQSSTQGPSWGNLHEQPIFFQHVPFLQAPQWFQAPHNFNQDRAQASYAPFMNNVQINSHILADGTYQQLLPSQSQIQVMQQPQASAQVQDRSRIEPYTARAPLAHSTRRRFPEHPAIVAEQKNTISPVQKQRELAVANPEDIPMTARPRGPQDGKPKQGGRKRNTHLNQDARERSSRMRKKGACWRCKLQRDPCPDDGTPCARCIIGSQKGQLYFFDCNRSKLPDFVMDFLPPSYTIMHSKQNIEDCVKDQVRGWDYTRPVEVCLTSGYGHPLRWVLYEFEPATLELLGQYQYLQNVSTRQAERCEKWSPPLGITKLEPSDDWHFKNYLDDLMADEPLAEFPWICFEEESQIDDFQATMLAMICELYRETGDYDLKQLLRKIIRMLIVTYIMGHTLTITQETLPMVHAHLRSCYKPANVAPHTSPRLANRQLKFFFHVIRNQIYEDILKWQQATLHTSGGKDTTWLSTFVVMLAFAMVLEEAQRTIQIQADAKYRKRERSYDEAQQEASNACERIDARFQLLVGLFQCKYRDKKWNHGGSFGPQTPRLKNQTEHNFCVQLRDLLEERQNHLRSRKDVPFSSQTQCQYTTRLVARFLLPFLELPG